MEDKELMAERLKAFKSYLEVLGVYEEKMLAMEIWARENGVRKSSKGYDNYTELIGLDVARERFNQSTRYLKKLGFDVKYKI
jgi:hypothetical protein